MDSEEWANAAICASIESDCPSDIDDENGQQNKGVGTPSFCIPELPRGQTLLFELLSAWGDDNDEGIVGLRSIEMFTADGTVPPVADIQSNAFEMITGTLPALFRMTDSACGRGEDGTEDAQEGKHDEIDHGVNNEDGMWLCKYVDNSDGHHQQQHRHQLSKCPVQIVVHFPAPQTLAMIRISNYSCPADIRFALRGVRSVRIWLDSQCIFCGEICCALPSAAGVENAVDASIGDTILFTTSEEILARIGENDTAMASAEMADEWDTRKSANGGTEEGDGGGGRIGTHHLSVQQQLGPVGENATLSRLVPSTRPTTGHSNSSSPSSTASSVTVENRQEASGAEQQAEDGVQVREEEADNVDENAIVAKVFHMELLANWGCADAIGLAGIQFLGPNFEPIADHLAKECVVRCEPSSGANGQRSKDDGGQLANLLNGLNLTCDSAQMWLSSAWNVQGPAPMLSFTFADEIKIYGVSVWNYNGSPELSYAGVRCARFYANGKALAIGTVLLRKAPGFLFFDFVQDVLFDRCPLIRPPALSVSPQTRSIAAFIFQIRLLSSWGDEFYIGLNGIELFNRQDLPIRLRPQNLAAFPESVNCLASVCGGDPRSSDKLIDGINDTVRAHHMWLTPILPNSYARVFIIFDTPTFVTRIRIFNYRKTPQRGVRHIAISADDLLLCSGAEVPMSSPDGTGILDVSLRDGDFM